MDYRTLRKYVRDHPDANEFLEHQTQDALAKSHSKLIAAAPTAAQRLIDDINDENNRRYVVVQAVESLFRIIDRGITDREKADQLKDIRESLNDLEVGEFLMSKIDFRWHTPRNYSIHANLLLLNFGYSLRLDLNQ